MKRERWSEGRRERERRGRKREEGERKKGDYGDKKGILQGDLNRIRIKRGIKKDIMKRVRESGKREKIEGENVGKRQG